ncbi:PLD nuclease N-terminal domain-containing protein [Kineococcus terrestris]|uniref:PLD nuclease N-terminal domain-containing protein n=1 Tax=Kineococcus terrestris TaxID=2044856 RepID=UPI0034DB517E
MTVLRALAVLVPLALAVYSLFDIAQSRDAEVRMFPRWAWVLLVVFVPIVGPAAYLVAGRPLPPGGHGGGGGRGGGRGYGGPGGSPSAPPRGPDDDEDFLRRLREQPPR